MKSHYRPAFNARVYGPAEHRADIYWRNRRMDIADRRKAVYREILNLKSLPRKNMEQEYRLAELEAEYKRLMRCEK